MLGLVAAFGLSLALTRVHILIGVGVMVLGVVVVAVVGGSARRKRAIIYGALAGVGLIFAVLGGIDWARGDWPGGFSMGLPPTLEYARPYVFPIGAFVGALAGSTFAGWKPSRS